LKKYERKKKSMTIEHKAIEDLLKLQSEAFGQHKDQIKEHVELTKEMLAKLEEERKEWKAGRELLEELVREYDRLTQRVSLQLRALIQVTERLEKVN
jgi:dsDNA-specific endonuclease/ATPase MutS2